MLKARVLGYGVKARKQERVIGRANLEVLGIVF